ncbi:MAG: hypothetical protein GXO66_08630 [Euryarchaeota archaeon]|nr:hypothetical protein [Euryarchaeota archaeon]
MSVTLERVHEDLMTIMRDIKKIMEYLEEDELELSEEIKQQIIESRKRHPSEFIPHEEIEKELFGRVINS